MFTQVYSEHVQISNCITCHLQAEGQQTCAHSVHGSHSGISCALFTNAMDESLGFRNCTEFTDL